jgi:methanogenic corrinoid protein MtbC1
VGQLLSSGQSIGEIAAVGREKLLASAGENGSSSALKESYGSPPVELLRLEVLQAAVALDEGRARRALDRLEILLTKREIVHVLLPMISREIGSMWVAGKATVASEHMLTALLRERIQRWTELDSAQGQGEGKILCAGFPDEQHELGILIVAYELRAAGREVLCLGPGMPFLDLELAIAAAKPRTVCLSVTRQVVFEVHRPRFAEMVRRLPEIVFVVGGAGAAQFEEDLLAMGATPWPAHRSLSDLAESMP